MTQRRLRQIRHADRRLRHRLGSVPGCSACSCRARASSPRWPGCSGVIRFASEAEPPAEIAGDRSSGSPPSWAAPRTISPICPTISRKSRHSRPRSIAETLAHPGRRDLDLWRDRRHGSAIRPGRAVGQALGRNPWPIVIPCHRVTGADGRMGGFSAPGGRATKLRLLEIEGALAPETLPLFGMAAKLG